MEEVKTAEKSKDIIEEPEKDIVSISTTTEIEIDDKFVERLERNIASYRKMIIIALKLTNEQDWTNQNGKPYLDCSGAEKIANPFGIQVKGQRRERINYKDEKGEYYVWEYTAIFSSIKLGRPDGIEISGHCSSRDKFFAKVTEYVDNKKVVVLKPLEEVNQVHIQQKAQTNMYVNGIKRLIGLRNLTWEQLDAAGLKKDRIVGVQYGERAKTQVTKQQFQDKKEKLFK